MQLLKNAFGVARLESVLFRRFPKLRMSVAGIVLIPALYARSSCPFSCKPRYSVP
jgi:putative membrane protein